MKNYIRICLSLDNETKEMIEEIADFYHKPMSKTVKKAIYFYYITVYKQKTLEEKERKEELFGWKK